MNLNEIINSYTSQRYTYRSLFSCHSCLNANGGTFFWDEDLDMFRSVPYCSICENHDHWKPKKELRELLAKDGITYK